MNVDLLKRLWQAFGDDKVMRLASSIAFTAIFSIAPLLIILIAIVGWIVGVENGGHGHHIAEDAMLGQIAKGAGAGTADAVRSLVTASFAKPRQSIVAQVIGWIVFILGATGLFSALQDGLNAIWHVEATKGGIKQVVRDRLASFGMILLVGFILLLTLGANAVTAFAGAHFTHVPIVGTPALLAVVDQVVTLILLTIAFALIYKILPDVDIAWRDVWTGSAVTALLFVAGEALIAWYFAVAGVASAYGAAGSLLAGLLWIYYSAIILLIGAEFTKVAAGAATTTAPSTVRKLTDVPAGVDPRNAAAVPDANVTR
jgi:membrane protein